MSRWQIRPAVINEIPHGTALFTVSIDSTLALSPGLYWPLTWIVFDSSVTTPSSNINNQLPSEKNRKMLQLSDQID